MSSTSRRASIALAAATLLLATTGIAAAQPSTTTDDPAAAAAGWLTTQLTDGDHVYIEAFEWQDVGLTADTLYALAGVGVAAGTIDDIADWLETQAGSYVGPGATAKLILATEIAGRDATSADLVETLTSFETTAETADEERAVGQFFGSWNSTLNQALAVLALATVDGVDPSDDAVGFLLAQQCDEGGFSGALLDDGGTCTGGDVDTTAFAVDALLALDHVEAAAAAERAVAWLVDTQAADGSFIGDGGPSSNSTGLAALALRLGGEDAAADAARNWILDLQAGCDTDTPGAILADADGAGDALRATPQALLGVIGESLTTITAAGATDEVPLLDCPDPEPREVSVTCDVTGEVLPGQRVDCAVTGLDADEVVHVLVTLNPTLLDEDLVADAGGTAPFTFAVPDDTNDGATITIVVDGEGDALLASLSLAVGVAEAAPEPAEEAPQQPAEIIEDEPREGTEAGDGELPRTGATSLQLGGVAWLLLVSGAAVLVTARRRTELT